VPLDDEGFARTVRLRILGREGIESDPVAELANGLAALMHVRCWPMTVNWDTMQRHQAALGVDAVANDFRWRVLERWAVYLGFAWRLPEGLVPDPTAAVEDLIDDLVPPDEDVPIAEFRRGLGEHIPVIDGGPVFERLGAASSDDTHLSAPLSLALLRLQRRRVLAFPPPRGDAPNQLSIVLNGIVRAHSHVRRASLDEALR
jgi:hypothetical protein